MARRKMRTLPDHIVFLLAPVPCSLVLALTADLDYGPGSRAAIDDCVVLLVIRMCFVRKTHTAASVCKSWFISVELPSLLPLVIISSHLSGIEMHVSFYIRSTFLESTASICQLPGRRRPAGVLLDSNNVASVGPAHG